MEIFYGKDEALVASHVVQLYPNVRFVNAQKDLVSALSDACSSSLFSQGGPCALTNCNFLIAGTVNASEKEGLAGLKDLDCSQLILIASGDKLTVNEFINKNVISKAKTKKIAQLNEKSAHQLIAAESQRHGIAMDDAALDLFFTRLPLNWGVLLSEFKKIAMLDKKKVGAADIAELISKYTDDTVFTWIDSLLEGRTGKCYALYLQLKANGTEEGELMGILAGQLVFMKCAIMAYKRTPTAQGVAAALNLPVFRVANNLHFIAKTSLKKINELLYDLNRCDLLMKEGAISKEAALKVLIISAIGLGAYGRNN